MPNGNILPRFRRAFEVFTHPIINADLALFDQQHDPRGKKLFADRTYLVNGVWLGGYVQLDVRQAVAFRLDDLAVLDGGEGDARDMLLLHLGLDVFVNLIRSRSD